MKIDPTPKPHFFSNGVMPGDLSKNAAKSVSSSSSNNSNSGSKYLGESKADVELRSELPARFRYTPPEDLEIEDINFGGAEVLLK